MTSGYYPEAGDLTGNPNHHFRVLRAASVISDAALSFKPNPLSSRQQPSSTWLEAGTSTHNARAPGTSSEEPIERPDGKPDEQPNPSIVKLESSSTAPEVTKALSGAGPSFQPNPEQNQQQPTSDRPILSVHQQVHSLGRAIPTPSEEVHMRGGGGLLMHSSRLRAQTTSISTGPTTTTLRAKSKPKHMANSTVKHGDKYSTKNTAISIPS